MRIQHNIMAMNAYRNYNNNTSALSQNLEKLSSGYKINRAGDDAAGLAISEKMRAQITGLDQAQDNAQSGINLVQTAEGALQEVHDMLNRMVKLADQSANGTFDNEVDRKNLQDEVDQLMDEIDRIADSANYNGINLLDGTMAASQGVTTVKQGTTDATLAAAAAFTQEITLSSTAGSLTDGSTYTVEAQYLDADGNAKKVSFTFTATAGDTSASAAAATLASGLQSAMGSAYTVTQAGGKLSITAAAGQNESNIFSFKILDSSGSEVNNTSSTLGTVTPGKDATLTVALDGLTAGNKDTLEIDGKKFQIVTRGQTADEGYNALYVDQSTNTLNEDSVKQIAAQLKDLGYDVSASSDGDDLVFSKLSEGSKSQGGLTLQIGDTSDSFNQLLVSIQDMHAQSLGIDGINIGTQADAQAAVDVIKAAINTVSSVRGTLGATQNRLDHTINNLSVMQENIQDAESTIRDTDVADEMMAYTKNNILVQSAQAMLAQANQVPQGVLQLLQ